MTPSTLPLRGLPEHGVLLTGGPNAPVISNNTSRRIIGWTIRYINSPGPSVDATGLALLSIRNHPGEPDVIPAYSERAIPQNQRQVTGPRGPSTTLQAILDAVIFDDGEVVGPDTSHTFEKVTARIQAEQDMHQRVLQARALPANAKQAV
jgi:hypothetical protein